MAQDDFLVSYLKKEFLLGKCEVGMHLHSWNTPPQYPIDLSLKGRPYLFEYPKDIMEEKIASITKLLEEKFENKMLSHRAGRWGINDQYCKILEKYGYKIDCSITPGVNWSNQIGNSASGMDYSKEKKEIHLVKCCKDLIEVPMSIEKLYWTKIDYKNGFVNTLKSGIKSIIGKNVWLRPSISSLDDIKALVMKLDKEKMLHIEFMMHSSEFMPGGSPYYKTYEDIERMYENLKEMFKFISLFNYKGCSLRQIYELCKNINAK